MQLTRHEQERLMVSLAAMVARDRLAQRAAAQPSRGRRHHRSFVLEGARDGRSVAELMSAGRTVLASRT